MALNELPPGRARDAGTEPGLSLFWWPYLALSCCREPCLVDAACALGYRDPKQGGLNRGLGRGNQSTFTHAPSWLLGFPSSPFADRPALCCLAGPQSKVSRCQPNEHNCLGTELCIHMSKLCNGLHDCFDGSDEGPHCRGRCLGGG